jgi:hypothetical protein
VAVCFEREPGAPEGHEHVSAVITQDPDGGETRWTAVEFVSAIRTGEEFVAIAADGQRAALEPAVCPRCPTVTITVEPHVLVNVCADQP